MDLTRYTLYRDQVGSLPKRFMHYPRVISIETLVLCNAKCSFCPYPTSDRKGERMEDDLFYKIIDDLSDIPPAHRVSFTLARINEPLLDKRLQAFSEYTKSRIPGAIQMFWSNGTSLNPGNYEWMTDFPGATLHISLNSVDPVAHKALMGISFDKVIRNLDRLHALKDSGGFGPDVLLHAPYQSEQAEAEMTARCARQFPLFKLHIRPFFVWQGGNRAGQSEQDAAGLVPMLPGAVTDLPCAQWFDLHVLANGFTTRCCIDETGFDQADFDLRHNHALAVFARSAGLREKLPGRGSIGGCETCTHLG